MFIEYKAEATFSLGLLIKLNYAVLYKSNEQESLANAKVNARQHCVSLS